MQPQLSIVVPVLNEAAGIEASLAALGCLRAQGAEVIVVDGSSVDATAALALPLVDQVIVSPRGRAAQMNAGARASHGAVLLFLHADTILPADAARAILDGLERERRDWGRFDVAITGTSPMLAIVARLMNARSRLTGIATGDQAIFVRRSMGREVSPRSR
jgi:glycosyltransferase involved in cell wall biosynthesis